VLQISVGKNAGVKIPLVATSHSMNAIVLIFVFALLKVTLMQMKFRAYSLAMTPAKSVLPVPGAP